MSSLHLALILSGVLLSALAQLLLKAGTNAVGHFDFHLANVIPVGLRLVSEPHIIGGLTCYAMSMTLWILALSRVPVSVAYPMVSLGYVVNVLLAWAWLGEALNLPKILGIGFIIIGVLFITRSST
jgi:drug/metabolite transporter (DMT)-like permease